MAEGFKIADGYVEVHAKYDKSEVEDAAREVGRESGSTYTRGFTERVRDEKGRFTKGVEDAIEPDRNGSRLGGIFGKLFSRSTLKSIGDGISAGSTGFIKTLTFGLFGGSLKSAFADNPYIASAGMALGAAVVAVAAPAIGAGLIAALGVGSGLGVILAGSILAFGHDPRLKAAGGELMRTIMGVDTAPLQDAYDKAQAAYTAAVKSGSSARIAQTRKERDESKKALDQALSFNSHNVSLPDLAKNAFGGPLLASVGALKTAFIQLTPSIKQMFDTVAPSIKPLTDGFVGLVKGAMPGFLKFLQSSAPMLKTLADNMPGLGKALSQFFELLAKGGPGATKFLGDFIHWLSVTIVEIGYLLMWLSKAYVVIRRFFMEQLPAAFHSVESKIKGVWHSISDFFSKLGSEIASWPGKIGGFLSRIESKVEKFIGKVVAWFESLPGKIGGFMSKLPGMIHDFFVRAFDLATTAIGYGAGLVVKSWADLPHNIMAAIDWLKDKLTAFWNFIWSNGKRLVKEGIDAVIDFFRQLPSRASAAVSKLWSSIVGHFNEAKTGASNSVRDLVDGAERWARQLPGRIGSAVSGAKDAVLRAFAGAGSWLYSAGADILHGIASGISSATGFVVDAAKRAAANIISGFKKALGISSPSKVMADEVGRWLPAGVVEGVERGLPDLRKAMGSLLPDAVSVVGNGGAGALPVALEAKAAGNTYVFHEGAIVLDASKIKSVQDLVDLVNSLKSTARSFRARGLAGVGVAA